MRTTLRLASMAVLAVGLMTGLGAAAMAAGPAAGQVSSVRSDSAGGIEKADYYYYRHRPYYGWYRPYYRPYIYAPPPVVYRPAPYYYPPYYYAPTYYYPY